MNMRNQKGQGFMEVIVAVGIMVMGIVSILILTSYNLTAAEYGENRLIASNLARESLEVIRNIRDSNWLAENDWDQDLPSSFSDNLQIVKFEETVTGPDYSLETSASDIETCGVPCQLYTNNTIFSHDSSGAYSGFRRLVEFNDICDDQPGVDNEVFKIMLVNQNCIGDTRVGFVLKSKVQWNSSNGDTREVVIEDRLFDWR
jgi:hypothetical protein